MAGDVHQRGFADDGGRRHHFGRKEKGERAIALDKIGADQTHHGLAGNAERQRHAGLRRDNPEADLAHLLCHGHLVARFQIARDHRAQNRIKAGLQLLRQRRHLLRHIIDAHHGRRRKKAKDCQIQSPRSPFNRVGSRQRHIPPRHGIQVGRFRPPADRPTITPEKRPKRRNHRGHHRYRIGQDQSVPR